GGRGRRHRPAARGWARRQASKPMSLPRGGTGEGQDGSNGKPMPTTRVNLPRVHIAGSDAHVDAHIEVGPHGFALFLATDAEYPLLVFDVPTQQTARVVRG